MANVEWIDNDNREYQEPDDMTKRQNRLYMKEMARKAKNPEEAAIYRKIFKNS